MLWRVDREHDGPQPVSGSLAGRVSAVPAQRGWPALRLTLIALGSLILLWRPAHALDDIGSAFYSNAAQTAFSSRGSNVASGWYRDFSLPTQVIILESHPGTLEVRSATFAPETLITVTMPDGRSLNGSPCEAAIACRVFYIGAGEFAAGSIALTASIGAQPDPSAYHAVHITFYEDTPSQTRLAYLPAVRNTIFRQTVETARLRFKTDLDYISTFVTVTMRALTVADAVGSVLTASGSTLAVVGNAGETALEAVLGFSDTDAAQYAGAALEIANGLGYLAFGQPWPAYQSIVQAVTQYGVLIDAFYNARDVAGKLVAQYMTEGLIRRQMADGTLFTDKSDIELIQLAETHILPDLVASGDCSVVSDVFLGCGFDSEYDQAEFLRSYKAMRTLLVNAANRFTYGNFYLDIDHDGVPNSQDSAPSDPTIPAPPTTPTTNHAPVAVVSASATSVTVNTPVTLNGLSSTDSDGDNLTYLWTLTRPSGSSASLSSTVGGTSSFTPDTAGTYSVALRVSDGRVESPQRSVMVTAAGSYPNVEIVYEDDGAHIYISNLVLGHCDLKQIGTFTVPPGERWTEIKFAASKSDLVLLVDDGATPALDGNSHNCTTGYTQGFTADQVYDYYPATKIFTWTPDLAPGAKLRIAAFSYAGLSSGSVNTKVKVSTDLDGDGVPDQNEPAACRNNPLETADSDGDGVCDHADAFPNDPAYSQIVPVNLTVAVAGNGMGGVTSSPAGIDCPGACSTSVDRGTSLALTAVPIAGSSFSGWMGGGCGGTSPTCNVTLFESTSITANFSQSLGVPGEPVIGIATAGDHRAEVAFSAPGYDGGSSITGYIALSSPGGMIGSCIAPCSSIVVPGLSNGTEYTFTVRASSSLGIGGSSSSSNSVIPQPVGALPGPPIVTSVMAGDGSATIAFSPPASDGGNPIVMYSVVSSPDALKGACLAPCSSIRVGGLANGMSYAFSVVAINGVGAGPQSELSAFVTPVDTTPAIFQFTDQTNVELNASITSNPIVVSGIDATTVASISGGSYSIDGGDFTGDNQLVANGQVVTVLVTASSNYATTSSAILTVGGISSTFRVTTRPQGSYSLTVTSPQSDLGLVVSDPPGISCGSACSAEFLEGTTVTLMPLPHSGSTFVGWEGATCSGLADCIVTMTSNQAVTSNFIATSVPGSPTNVRLVGDNRALRVIFSPPSSDGGSAITSYTATCTGGSTSKSVTGTASPLTVTGLTNGVSYACSVRATNGVGSSGESVAISKIVKRSSGIASILSVILGN